MQQTLDFISLVPSNMIIAIGNLIVLYLILKKLLFKPVTNMLAKRQAEVDGLYETAETAKAEAERVQSEYTGKIAQAEQQVDLLLTEGRARAAAKEREASEQAAADAAQILKKAESDAALLQRQAVQQLQGDLSDMAVEIAAKVIEKEVSEEDHGAMIAELLAGMKGEKA